ncbi:hypothetical protein CsSME_00052123 [Camellia sinensis var. sinensis]
MVKSQQNPNASITQGSLLPLTTIKLGSPSTSIEPSKSKSSKAKPKAKPKSPSSDELIQMVKLLMAQAKSEIEDEASDDSASSEALTSHDPYGPQFQDAQDQYT